MIATDQHTQLANQLNRLVWASSCLPSLGGGWNTEALHCTIGQFHTRRRRTKIIGLNYWQCLTEYCLSFINNSWVPPGDYTRATTEFVRGYNSVMNLCHKINIGCKHTDQLKATLIICVPINCNDWLIGECCGTGPTIHLCITEETESEMDKERGN